MARAACRRRIRLDASDRPIEHSASWFSLDVAARAPRPREFAPIEEGTLAYVEQSGMPALVIECVSYDENERPLTFERP